MNTLIALALFVAGASASALYRPHGGFYGGYRNTYFSKKLVYSGRFVGSCYAYNEGYFFKDESTYVQCDNGRAILQTCAAGTYNAPEASYTVGDEDPIFCGVKDETFPTNGPIAQEAAPTHGPIAEARAPTHGPIAAAQAPTHGPAAAAYAPTHAPAAAPAYEEPAAPAYAPEKVNHYGPFSGYDRAFDYGRDFYGRGHYGYGGYNRGYGY